MLHLDVLEEPQQDFSTKQTTIPDLDSLVIVDFQTAKIQTHRLSNFLGPDATVEPGHSYLSTVSPDSVASRHQWLAGKYMGRFHGNTIH